MPVRVIEGGQTWGWESDDRKEKKHAPAKKKKQSTTVPPEKANKKRRKKNRGSRPICCHACMLCLHAVTPTCTSERGRRRRFGGWPLAWRSGWLRGESDGPGPCAPPLTNQSSVSRCFKSLASTWPRPSALRYFFPFSSLFVFIKSSLLPPPAPSASFLLAKQTHPSSTSLPLSIRTEQSASPVFRPRNPTTDTMPGVRKFPPWPTTFLPARSIRARATSPPPSPFITGRRLRSRASRVVLECRCTSCRASCLAG